MDEVFYRDTWVEVKLDAIQHNVQNMRAHLPQNTQIMAVVKANAYGHGAKEVAEAALAAGAQWLGVAILDEAIALRKQGVEAPILVLGYVKPVHVDLAVTHNISLTVFQKEWVDQVRNLYKGSMPLFIHLKLDTGMGRIGVRSEQELTELLQAIKADVRFITEGVYTHFATADEEDTEYYKKQYERFKYLLDTLISHGIRPNIIHCGNSAASLKYPQSMFNMVRFGIAMYGLSPFNPKDHSNLPFPLEEAFSLHSRLTYIKKIGQGDCISYGATYCAEKEEWIGTLPIGYADGWLRGLSGQSEVLISGKRHPLVGRICMDQCMCQLDQSYHVGEKVTLIGQQGEEFISVTEIAERLQTINYEITCMISERVPRIYFINGEKFYQKNPVLSNISKN